jgi:hypothetical protein
MAFRRLLFFADAPTIPWPVNASEFTAFAVRFRTASGLDLSAPPLDRDGELWTHPMEYSACQALANTAREVGVEALRYRSARTAGRNLAILTCRAFATKDPIERQTWRLHIGSAGVRAFGDRQEERLAFDRVAFARDPRIASMPWDR